MKKRLIMKNKSFEELWIDGLPPKTNKQVFLFTLFISIIAITIILKDYSFIIPILIVFFIGYSTAVAIDWRLINAKRN